jgi:hypothetical protein
MFLREDFASFCIPMISADFWHTFHDTQEGDNYDLMEEGEKVLKKLQKLASSVSTTELDWGGGGGGGGF